MTTAIMYPILRAGGKGGLGRTVGKRVFHGFKAAEGIGLITKLKFLL
jgi:hypothetical protein